MAGKKLDRIPEAAERPLDYFAVKESVLPFSKFPGADIILGPEMKSTGEVMGLDKDFGLAFAKSQDAAGNNLPRSGAVTCDATSPPSNSPPYFFPVYTGCCK